ncbi:hypothetical protein LINPERHAP1_LOCUS31244 [Linum perenne]
MPPPFPTFPMPLTFFNFSPTLVSSSVESIPILCCCTVAFLSRDLVSLTKILLHGSRVEGTASSVHADSIASQLQIQKVYDVASFSLAYPRRSHREASYPRYLQLTPATTFMEVLEPGAEFVQDSFEFVPFDQLMSRLPPFAYLSDVVGRLVSISKPDHLSTVGGFAKKQSIIISNDSGVDLPVTLWGSFCAFLVPEDLMLASLSGLVVLDFGGMLVTSFREWVLAVGDGSLPPQIGDKFSDPDSIMIPQKFIVNPGSDAISSIVQAVYTQFGNSYKSLEYIKGRAIVTPTNKVVSKLNDHIMSLVPGEQMTYFSLDTLVPEGNASPSIETTYPPEFLNTLSFNGVPEHAITLKEYIPIMILRNLNPSLGLCNGTRVLITKLGHHVLQGIVIGGFFEGTNFDSTTKNMVYREIFDDMQ